MITELFSFSTSCTDGIKSYERKPKISPIRYEKERIHSIEQFKNEILKKYLTMIWEFIVIINKNLHSSHSLNNEWDEWRFNWIIPLFYSKYNFLYQMYTLNKQVIIIKGRAIKHAVTKSVWKTYILIKPGSQADSAP